MDEPRSGRVEMIEGTPTLVVERTPPIPPTLALFMEGGYDESGRRWLPLRTTIRRRLSLSGARASCADQDHRLADWLDGFYIGSDGIGRSLRLLACRDCGAVCVRDVSFDTLPGLSTGGRAPLRRDHVLGWYTGARPRQRVYT